MIIPAVRTALALLGLAALAFSVVPLFFGIRHAGQAALLVLAALCFLECFLLGERLCQRRPWEVFANRGSGTAVLRRVLGVCLALFLAAEAALSALMVRQGWHTRPDYTQPDTAVVLGCGIRGAEPSLMLRNRLEQALLYLEAVPQARVVVTGGLGRGESYTEADVEAQWLIQRGIDPQRILREDRSTDTYQNLEYTAALLTAANLPNGVVLFTDGFHQLRAQLYARRHGLSPAGIPSVTPWGLFPGYWLREQAAICAAFAKPDILAMFV